MAETFGFRENREPYGFETGPYKTRLAVLVTLSRVRIWMMVPCPLSSIKGKRMQLLHAHLYQYRHWTDASSYSVTDRFNLLLTQIRAPCRFWSTTQRGTQLAVTRIIGCKLFQRCSFGILNGPGTHQRTMIIIHWPVNSLFTPAYLWETIILSRDAKEYILYVYSPLISYTKPGSRQILRNFSRFWTASTLLS